MSKVLLAIMVVAGLAQPLVAGPAHAASLSADQYVRALTQHLQDGGELGASAEQNVRQLAAGDGGRVDQEAFVKLGNTLYRSGYGDLADLVMQSKTVAPDQYEGAELRVEWPHGADE